MKLDSNDLKLIELLKQDSRASVTSIAESMGIARVTTHDRMVKLKREGIIRRYTVDIDAKAWGYELRAFIFARCERGNVLGTDGGGHGCRALGRRDCAH